MTAADLEAYQKMLKGLSLDDLDKETKTVFDQVGTCEAGIMIQQCLNVYKEKQVPDRFLVVYNEAVGK